MLNTIEQIKAFIENTQKAKAIIESVADTAVNLNYFGRECVSPVPAHCGSTFCSLGHIAQDEYFQKFGYQLIRSELHPTLKRQERFHSVVRDNSANGSIRHENVFGPSGSFLFSGRNESIYDVYIGVNADKAQALHRFDNHLAKLQLLKADAEKLEAIRKRNAEIAKIDAAESNNF